MNGFLGNLLGLGFFVWMGFFLDQNMNLMAGMPRWVTGEGRDGRRWGNDAILYE